LPTRRSSDLGPREGCVGALVAEAGKAPLVHGPGDGTALPEEAGPRVGAAADEGRGGDGKRDQGGDHEEGAAHQRDSGEKTSSRSFSRGSGPAKSGSTGARLSGSTSRRPCRSGTASFSWPATSTTRNFPCANRTPR